MPINSTSLRVCLVGASSDSPAEGMENVYRALQEGLSSNAHVLALDGRDLARGRGWLALVRFRPHIVHYAAGPSNASFVLTAAIKAISLAKASVMSSIHPVGITPRIMRTLAPDLMLTQAHDTEMLYRSLRLQTSYLPNGVDKRRFSGVAAEERLRLRQEYGLHGTRRIALHVGHLKRGRNVTDLTLLQSRETQVLVVASPTTQPDRGMREELEQAGVLVWTHYLPRIEDIYRMSHVYVFPVQNRAHCIETPLSVMEAAAVGLPIISRAFGSLPRMYPECPSFRYYNHPAQLAKMAQEIHVPDGKLRDLTPDWDSVVRELLAMYGHLLARTGKSRDLGSTL